MYWVIRYSGLFVTFPRIRSRFYPSNTFFFVSLPFIRWELKSYSFANAVWSRNTKAAVAWGGAAWHHSVGGGEGLCSPIPSETSRAAVLWCTGTYLVFNLWLRGSGLVPFLCPRGDLVVLCGSDDGGIKFAVIQSPDTVIHIHSTLFKSYELRVHPYNSIHNIGDENGISLAERRINETWRNWGVIFGFSWVRKVLGLKDRKTSFGDFWVTVDGVFL